MRLPAEMEASFWQEIQQSHMEFAMEYMLRLAREALEKGMAVGREYGIKETKAGAKAKRVLKCP